jgi:hypothetical protein
MTEHQHVPVKVYRSHDLLTVAAPMAGLGAEDITVEVTSDGRLVLDGRLCAVPKLDRGPLEGANEVLVNEWMLGPYHRELVLGTPVDGPAAMSPAMASQFHPPPRRRGLLVSRWSRSARHAASRAGQSGSPTAPAELGAAAFAATLLGSRKLDARSMQPACSSGSVLQLEVAG